MKKIVQNYDLKYTATGFTITLVSGDTRHYNKKGKYHRVDGPAIVTYDNQEEYWFNGKRTTESATKKRMEKMKND